MIDNTYGMGIIDAYAAFNYLSKFMNPVPPNNIEDLIIEKVINTPMQINCEEMFNPMLRHFLLSTQLRFY